jgi:hypothetical protein
MRRFDQHPEVMEHRVEQACRDQMEYDYGNCGPGQVLSWAPPAQILLGCIREIPTLDERALGYQSLAVLIEWLQGRLP